MSWAERSTGISPTITYSCSRTCSAGSTASTPISADIVEQIDARLALFMLNAILDTRVLIAEELGAAPFMGSRPLHDADARRNTGTHACAHPYPRTTTTVKRSDTKDEIL
jgi:hypothetical protein